MGEKRERRIRSQRPMGARGSGAPRRRHANPVDGAQPGWEEPLVRAYTAEEAARHAERPDPDPPAPPDDFWGPAEPGAAVGAAASVEPPPATIEHHARGGDETTIREAAAAMDSDAWEAVPMNGLPARVEDFERRLGDLEAREAAGAAAEGFDRVDREIPTATDVESDQRLFTWLSDRVDALTDQMEEHLRLMNGRMASVDDAVARAGSEAVTRAESHAVVIAEVKAQVHGLMSSQKYRETPTCPGHQSLAATVAELQRQVGVAAERARAVDARIAQLDALPSVMEDIAAEQFERLAVEPSLPVDIEGLYKELDSVAEVLSTRDAAVARSLDQVKDIETAVLGLREELGRVVDGLAAARSTEGEARGRIQGLERRLMALESPEAEIERLHIALGRVIGGSSDAAVPPGGGDMTSEVGNGDGSAPRLYRGLVGQPPRPPAAPGAE